MTSQKTGIEWTDATWNPIRGCSRVSEGCRHCYAEGQAARIISIDRGRGMPEGQGSYDGLLAKGGQWNGQIKVVESVLEQPLHWSKPRRIFVNSMSDLFHENVPDKVIQRIFAVMASAPHHTFQVLTKRAERMREVLRSKDARWIAEGQLALTREGILKPGAYHVTWPLPNVWLGVTVENQAAAETRIPLLLETPAAVRWLSMEPLLSAIDLTGIWNIHALAEGQAYINALRGFAWEVHGIDYVDTCNLNGSIDWVVVGGESGPHARPMHPDWALSLRDQCAAAGVPFLFKQWGEWVPRSACYHTFEDGKSCSEHDPSSKRWPCIRLTEKGHDGRHLENADQGCDAYMQRVGKKMAGRLLNGELHDAYPTRGEAA